MARLPIQPHELRTKVCTKCLKEKPRDQFYVLYCPSYRRTHPNGKYVLRQAKCIRCNNRRRDAKDALALHQIRQYGPLFFTRRLFRRRFRLFLMSLFGSQGQEGAEVRKEVEQEMRRLGTLPEQQLQREEQEVQRLERLNCSFLDK